MGDAISFIAQHGGVRKFAKKFNFPLGTVGGWSANNRIPPWRWAQIEAKLKELGE